jgi:hypothetical protein
MRGATGWQQHSLGDAMIVFLSFLIGTYLLSSPALAETVAYPVSGVFAAIDSEFPNAEFEVCMSVRTFGVAAVTKKSVAELIIFTRNKRHDLRGDIQTETAIRAINLADGAYRITETFIKSRGWIGIRRKTEYELKVIDPNTIAIWDGKKVTRYAKCAGSRGLWI